MLTVCARFADRSANYVGLPGTHRSQVPVDGPVESR